MCSNRPWMVLFAFNFVFELLVSLKCGGFIALTSCYLFSLFFLCGFGSSYTCLWSGCCFEHFNFTLLSYKLFLLLYSWAFSFPGMSLCQRSVFWSSGFEKQILPFDFLIGSVVNVRFFGKPVVLDIVSPWKIVNLQIPFGFFTLWGLIWRQKLLEIWKSLRVRSNQRSETVKVTLWIL